MFLEDAIFSTTETNYFGFLYQIYSIRPDIGHIQQNSKHVNVPANIFGSMYGNVVAPSPILSLTSHCLIPDQTMRLYLPPLVSALRRRHRHHHRHPYEQITGSHHPFMSLSLPLKLFVMNL